MIDSAVIESIRGHFADQLAWGCISADLTILSYSSNWAKVLGDNNLHLQTNTPLTDYFDELIGLNNYIPTFIQSHSAEFRLERINRSQADGTVAYYDFTFLPIKDSEDILFVIENVTEFGRLEQQIVQERNELRLIRQQLSIANEKLRLLDQFKSLFFSMAAHDLRSPLMTVRGYSELLTLSVQQDMAESSRTQALDYIHTIQTQANWLDQLVHNILDLNQIENERFELNCELCNLNDLVLSAAEALRPMSRLNEQTLTVELAEKGILLNADVKRIEQSIHNVIANAIKYTPANGKINITVYAENGQGIIKIADTGRGVEAEQIPHLFDLYYRTTNAIDSKITGTGLGLFIVHQIITMHNGTIDVTSTLGQGSTFTIRLPLRKMSPPSSAFTPDSQTRDYGQKYQSSGTI